MYGTVHFLIVTVPEIYKNAYVMGAHGWWISSPFSLDIFTKPWVIVMMVLVALLTSATWSGINLVFWFADEKSIDYVCDFFQFQRYPTYVIHDIRDVEKYVIIIYWDHGFLDGFNTNGIFCSAVLGFMMLGA
ncbi:hypothetical protein PENTCL1PPCAC_12914 [Pristionchus entomophagus]|uniref:G protein-coupled receptor n=1 Tax=Pristionchus entomophagus TaxID=358040 RepID=A0AAV5T604_9BILA|nr:hypothetical protein PENTCL1PPCAC_12914 [Pristionchus entomophagus]